MVLALHHYVRMLERHLISNPIWKFWCAVFCIFWQFFFFGHIAFWYPGLQLSSFYSVVVNIGIHTRELTRTTQEFIFLIILGGLCPDKSDVEHYLNSKPSKALVVTPDGAAGATFSRPGNEYLFRRNHRKGFIRIALRTGYSIPLIVCCILLFVVELFIP